MPEITAPPKWILFLLWPFMGETCYPQIEGDLSEEFHQRESEHGVAAARRWYYREVCRNLGSLLWRWVTIAVIILPLFCIALSNILEMQLVRSMSSLLWHHWSISWIICGWLLNLTIIGLLIGTICSLVLRGHERMVRLVFGAYYLGSMVVIFHRMGINLPSRSIPSGALGVGLIYLRPVWLLICTWTGSIWIGRRQHRRRSPA